MTELAECKNATVKLNGSLQEIMDAVSPKANEALRCVLDVLIRKKYMRVRDLFTVNMKDVRSDLELVEIVYHLNEFNECSILREGGGFSTIISEKVSDFNNETLTLEFGLVLQARFMQCISIKQFEEFSKSKALLLTQ